MRKFLEQINSSPQKVKWIVYLFAMEIILEIVYIFYPFFLKGLVNGFADPDFQLGIFYIIIFVPALYNILKNRHKSISIVVYFIFVLLLSSLSLSIHNKDNLMIVFCIVSTPIILLILILLKSKDAKEWFNHRSNTPLVMKFIYTIFTVFAVIGMFILIVCYLSYIDENKLLAIEKYIGQNKINKALEKSQSLLTSSETSETLKANLYYIQAYLFFKKNNYNESSKKVHKIFDYAPNFKAEDYILMNPIHDIFGTSTNSKRIEKNNKFRKFFDRVSSKTNSKSSDE